MPSRERPKPPAGGVKANYLGFVAPALATSIDKVPSGERWVHEVKFDRYRVQVHIANEAVRIFTRNGHDWTNRFAKIAADGWHLNVKSAIIDGEVIVPVADGVSDSRCCGDLEPSLGSSGHGEGDPISYFARAISDGSEMIYDCEGEHDGREPDLGWTVGGAIGDTSDGELTSPEAVL